MTPEGKVEAYLKKRVAETGGRQRKLRWLCRRGAPDRFVWWPGPVDGPHLHFVEVKRPGGTTHPLQTLEMGRLQNDGFNVHVVSSEADVDAFIEQVTSGLTDG